MAASGPLSGSAHNSGALSPGTEGSSAPDTGPTRGKMQPRLQGRSTRAQETRHSPESQGTASPCCLVPAGGGGGGAAGAEAGSLGGTSESTGTSLGPAGATLMLLPQ